MALFSAFETAECYGQHVENIGAFYPFPQHCNGLIANMLLYHFDSSIAESLREPKRISYIFEQTKELVKMGFEYLDRKLEVNVTGNIGPLIQTLIEMKRIFGSCEVNRSCLLTTSTSLEISYTDTEESWLKHQFELFQTEYISVDLPKEYLDDLTNLLLTGRPVGESFVASWMGTMTERVRRVLTMHPEFANLTNREQVNNCVFLCLIIMIQIYFIFILKLRMFLKLFIPYLIIHKGQAYIRYLKLLIRKKAFMSLKIWPNNFYFSI